MHIDVCIRTPTSADSFRIRSLPTSTLRSIGSMMKNCKTMSTVKTTSTTRLTMNSTLVGVISMGAMKATSKGVMTAV